ncbi:hypothetical protein [Vibrio furnissii]|uniref:hypothetical protein n=1 Tax=Vibrio furnissii TaxID=29494 RepID=UPI0020C18A7D|nr:hypothetical protein [Vibrio furnissii]
MRRFITMLVATTALSGCSIQLPFNDRISYQSEKEILSQVDKIDYSVNIVWSPDNFTRMFETKGSSGFVGSGTRTRIPTGYALSSRIEEAINTYAEFNPNSERIYFYVEGASSEFEFSANAPFTANMELDHGYANLKVTIKYNDRSITKEYQAEKIAKDGKTLSQTGVLEAAWDDIAVQVAMDVYRLISR